MTLVSVLEKFASFFQIFNFLKFLAAYRGGFPLYTQSSAMKLFTLFLKTYDGAWLYLHFKHSLNFSFERWSKFREFLYVVLSS